MNLETNFEVKVDEFYLCFVDTNNKLSKIEEERLIISPFESNIRKFYIVANNLLNKIVYTDAYISGFNIEEYEVKTILNKNNTVYSDFIHSSSSVVLNNNNKPFYDNAVNFDILLTSFSNKTITTNLNIKVDLKNT